MKTSKTTGITAVLIASLFSVGCMSMSGMRFAAYSRAMPQPAPISAESYDHQADNPFFDAKTSPLSTFSVDVDTASYSNIRRMLKSGTRPPVDAVRIEEMLNYFSYDYKTPGPDAPVAIDIDSTTCPWSTDHQLVRIGLRAKSVTRAETGPRNLVFLLDVSGSMSPRNRLPMIVQAMKMLVDQLDEKDSVAIVVYAGASGLVLPPTSGDRKGEIRAALDRLMAGGLNQWRRWYSTGVFCIRKSFQKRWNQPSYFGNRRRL